MVKPSFYCLSILLILCQLTFCCKVQQVHLTLGESFMKEESPIKYRVGFITKDSCKKSPYLEIKHNGEIKNLLPDDKNIYSISDGNLNYSSTAYFIDIGLIEYDKPYQLQVNGDDDGKPYNSLPFHIEMSPKTSFDEYNYAIVSNVDGNKNSKSIIYDISKSDEQNFDAIFHIGGFAFNIEEEKGMKGDHFFDNYGLMIKAPFFVVPGESESYDEFNQFNYRFKMQNDEKIYEKHRNNIYWFVQGSAHFTVINLDYALAWEKKRPKNNEVFENFYNILKDSQKNTDIYWRIVMSSKPIICGDTSTYCTMNSLLYNKYLDVMDKFKVDIFLAGTNQFRYERQKILKNFTPSTSDDYKGKRKNVLYNSKKTVHFINGCGGHNLQEEHSGPETGITDEEEQAVNISVSKEDLNNEESDFEGPDSIKRLHPKRHKIILEGADSDTKENEKSSPTNFTGSAITEKVISNKTCYMSQKIKNFFLEVNLIGGKHNIVLDQVKFVKNVKSGGEVGVGFIIFCIFFVVGAYAIYFVKQMGGFKTFENEYEKIKQKSQ